MNYAYLLWLSARVFGAVAALLALLGTVIGTERLVAYRPGATRGRHALPRPDREDCQDAAPRGATRDPAPNQSSHVAL